MNIFGEPVPAAPATPSAEETPPPATVTPPASEDPPPEPAPTPEPDPEPPIPKGVQKRIDRAVRRQYEAEADARILRERLRALESGLAQPSSQPTPQRPAGSPKIEDFQNFDEYVAAMAAHIAEEKVKTTLTEREQRQRAEAEQAAQRRIYDSWQKKVEQATAEMPDFEEVLSNADLPMTPVMQSAIMESDIGPRLAFHLATHPDEAVQIAQLSPHKAILALGRLEEKLTAAPVKKPTSTPPPVPTTSPRGALKKDPGQMSDAEYEKWRKTGKAA